MSLLAKMDRLVYATGLDRIVFMKVQPRTFRWAPLLVFAALGTGYALLANEGRWHGSHFLIGWSLFYGAYLAASFMRIFGPRFTGTERDPLDERELVVKAKAHAVSGTLIAVLAMLACFYMGAADLVGLWRPSSPVDWVNLGFGLQASGMLLPTWIASWMQPRPFRDGGD